VTGELAQPTIFIQV